VRAIDGSEIEVAAAVDGRADEGSASSGRSAAAVAVGYLAALSAAELVTALVAPRVGLFFHAVLLVVLFLHTALDRRQTVHRLLLCLSLVPLMRLLSLSLPLADFHLSSWYLTVTVPLLAAAVAVMHVLDLSWRDVGLSRGRVLVQLGIALAGLPLGYVEHYVLHPEPLSEALTLGEVWLPSLILMICTGFGEELVFRGLIQRTAGQVLGGWDVIYAATLSAVTCVGYGSLTNALFVLGVAAIFGWIRRSTGSILGISVAHGLTNAVLFLVMPFVGG
jgi:hypothetical protein